MTATFTTAAYASQNDYISYEQKSLIKEQLNTLGVDENKIDSLIIKLENGEDWDSFSGEYSNMMPTEIYKSTDDSIIERFVYPDGSVKVRSLSLPPKNQENMVGPLSVSGGSWTYGSGYATCTGAMVSESIGLLQMLFYADFTHVQNGYDMIDNIYDWEITTLLSTYEDVEFNINRSRETSSKPAEATLKCKYTLSGPGASRSVYLRLNVQDDSAWSSDNM